MKEKYTIVFSRREMEDLLHLLYEENHHGDFQKYQSLYVKFDEAFLGGEAKIGRKQ